MVTGFAGSVSRNFCEGILRLPSCTASWKLRIHSFVCVFCCYQMCILYMLDYFNIISNGQEIMISWYCVVQVGYVALGKTCWLIVIRSTQRRVPPKYIKLKTLFTAIQSTFRSLEMHSKWHYNLYLFGLPRGSWVFSKLQGLHYYLPNSRCNSACYESENFSDSSLHHIFESENFRFPFSRKIA